ncbi:transposase, partial [Escherichia coli]|nr:transposase [Escherichia coli]
PLPGSWTGTGISSAWTLPSNGVVEGYVNRLKMLKRQMYGRAGFELLRQRVMSPLA